MTDTRKSSKDDATLDLFEPGEEPVSAKQAGATGGKADMKTPKAPAKAKKAGKA